MTPKAKSEMKQAESRNLCSPKWNVENIIKTAKNLAAHCGASLNQTMKNKATLFTSALLAAATTMPLLGLTACKKHAEPTPVNTLQVWTSSEIAAPDSIEGKLRSQGKHWTKITGGITVGAYVQDTLEGRLDQPAGRGAIGRVISVTSDPKVTPAAKVDFGRGYAPGINLSELSLVSVAPD